MPDALHPRGLRAEEAARYCGISRSSLHALVARGQAPRPVHPTPGIAIWLREDLDRWLDGLAGRPAPSPQPVNSWDALLGHGDGAA